MRVQIVSVGEGKEGQVMVTFAAPCGVAVAQWRGRDRARPGDSYDIEFDVFVIVDRASNAQTAEDQAPAMMFRGEAVLLCGSIEAVYDDGVAYLRLAPDCIMMVNTAGDISAGDFVQISVPASALAITPY
jgi:hypothetical protein